MGIYKRIALIAAICLSSVGCDQITKGMAAEYLPREHMLSFLQDTLRIGYTENPGAFLSMGSDLAPEVRFWVFIVGVGVLLAAMAGYLVASKSITKTSLTGFSLLLSGGMSNLFDRVMNNGAVIDFLNVGIGSVRTGVFNVADVANMLGFAVLLLHRPQSYEAMVSGDIERGGR